jgi:hypothetical protein
MTLGLEHKPLSYITPYRKCVSNQHDFTLHIGFWNLTSVLVASYL